MILLLTIGFFPAVLADNIDDFVSSVNTNWVAQNYTGMEQVVEARLDAYTNDLSAMLVLMHLHGTIESNLVLAQSYVPPFTNAAALVNWSLDREAEVLCHVVALEVLDPSAAQSGGCGVFGLNSNQLEQLHAEFPTNHPLAPFLLRIGRAQYGD